MGMNHVEVARALADGLDQERAGGVRIVAFPSQAQRARPHGVELGFRARISAGEQGDVVTEVDRFVHEPGDHPFGAAVQLGRNALGQRRKLGDPH